MITVVAGQMAITTDATRKKIVSLEETYEKIERLDRLYAITYLKRSYFDPIANRAKEFFSPALEAIKTLSRYVLTIALWLGIASIVYTNFLHDSFQLLTATFVADLKEYTPIWFAVSFVIVQLLPFLKRTIDPDLSVSRVEGDDDLRSIRKEIEGADSVEIISGDFSFIDKDGDLQDCLRTLAFAGKLRLTSYKAEDEVTRELNTKSVGREILLKLRDDNAITFSYPVRAKITLVEHGGSKRMIYRFAKQVSGSTKLFMGRIHGTSNTQQLLEVIGNSLSSNRGQPK